MEKEEEVDRRGRKTVFKSGLFKGWTLPAQLGLLKIGQDGKGLLPSHLWCRYNLARLWDRLDCIESRPTFYLSLSLQILISSWA